MFGEVIRLWESGEYSYPLACGFVPNLVSYIHEDEKIRPCMLIVPGGGYRFVSQREGEIVARTFYDKGYNTFVLTYTTDLTMTEPLKEQPMKDLARAIRKIRQGAERYQIDPKKVILCGFSAGGHLCASVCVHYEDIQDEHRVYKHFSCRPDAVILSYPVITSGVYAHRGSFEALYGKEPSEKEMEYMWLEKHVTERMPPCFVWHTVDDQTVPVENSHLFARACKDQGVLYAFHIFSHGKHGLSLANEQWASRECGGAYTKEQMQLLVKSIENGTITLPKEAEEKVYEEVTKVRPKDEPNEEVSIWPELADRWVKAILVNVKRNVR